MKKRSIVFGLLILCAIAGLALAAGMRDLHHNIAVSRAISPVSVSDNTAQVSQIIDTSGYGSCEFVIAATTIGAGASLIPMLEDGDNASLTDNAAVTAANLIGTIAGATFAATDDNTVKSIGYKGNKRYLRLTVTPDNNVAAILFSAVALRGHPKVAPAQ